MRWHIYSDGAELAETAARAILRIGDQAIAERGDFHLVLAGGAVPQATYQQLGKGRTDWSRWVVYFGDERCLSREHPDRNSSVATAAWLARVAIPRHRIFPIPTELGADEGAEAYRSVLAGVGSFDLVLLGLGADGHTAGLFPGHDWGQGVEDASVLAVRAAPEPPAERVSLSAFRLSHARQVFVFVSGKCKAPVVAAWRAGNEIPIAAIRPPLGVDALLTLDAWP